MARGSPLIPITLALSLGACAVGPDYHRPQVAVPVAYKEAAGWKPAAPADALDQGDWWRLFDDPLLNELEAQVVVSNQNLAAAEAAYRQARAFVAENRAAYFPVLTLTGTITDSSGAGQIVSGVPTSGASGTRYQVSLGSTWAPDLWGRVRRAVENADALAQASAADVGSARLSAQIELASNYLQLRATDEQIRLLEQTARNFEAVLRVTRNRYAVGVAAQADVLAAQAQLDGAKAQAVALAQTRAQFEHAIAVLIGRPPAGLTIAPAPFGHTVPDVPVGMPSVLLERRPDVASAERQAAAANATIGVQTAAFYPTVVLTASYGATTNSLARLFSAPTDFWTLGGSAAEIVFDGGARSARVREARAAYDQSAALYRQTVLVAFQQVEDALSATRVLEQEVALRRRASDAADRVETVVTNQYRAGTAAILDVVVAQNGALTARTNLIQVEQARLVAVVSLIEALGGGWSTAQMRPG